MISLVRKMLPIFRGPVTLKPELIRVLIRKRGLVVLFKVLQHLGLYLSPLRNIRAVRKVQLNSSNIGPKVRNMDFLQYLGPAMLLKELTDLLLKFNSACINKPPYDQLEIINRTPVVDPCPRGVPMPPRGVYGETGLERISATSRSSLVIRLSASACRRSWASDLVCRVWIPSEFLRVVVAQLFNSCSRLSC